MEALLIVDFQNDFTPGGALEVPDGDAIAGRLNELAADPRFELVVATRDWHPPAPRLVPRARAGPGRCTACRAPRGPSCTPTLDRSRGSTSCSTRARTRATEGYSAFEATGLEELLRERGVDRLTVAGLATDVCVLNTALDALDLGFEVEVDREAAAGSSWRRATPSARSRSCARAGAEVR